MQYYQKNIEESNRMLAALKRKINTLALSRLAVIIIGAALLFRVVQTEYFWGVIAVFFVIILLFAGLVFVQSREEEKRTRWNAFAAINQNEIGRQAGKPGIYDDGSAFADPRHAYTDDLDVFGEQSLYALTNRCATHEGKSFLAKYFRNPAEREVIVQRQTAVRELATDRDWVQQLQVDLYAGLHRGEHLKSALLHYISDQGQVLKGRFLSLYVQAAPFILSFCLLMTIWLPVFGRISIYLLVAHLLAALWFSPKTNLIAGRFDKIGGLLRTFSDALIRIENRAWQSAYLQHLRAKLQIGKREKEDASHAIKKLADILGRLDYRLNMLVGALMNMVFLWDFRQLLALQEWKKQYGSELIGALDVVGETEALNSLAVLAINHPQWSFPEIHEPAEKLLIFEEMNHPLIDVDQAVANSYARTDHRIALITGSNMAGKSTFLRTAGINTVLALCGAPVCARYMQVSVMHLITYMRIKDSLQESTSTFKAELDRMKLILHTLREQPYSFFLIDEMLRGTNSVDKYRGSKAIIERLISEEATGMVATHDLQLAGLEQKYPGEIRNYHFDILVQNGEMQFDYKLKDGECKIFNASMLLRGIGIDVDSTATT